MHPAIRTLARPAAGERGVALPLALLGLISVSLLVTTALVTSSTELAISNAHQDATAGLYLAEGGLQTYVAARGTVLMADTGGTFSYQPPSGGAGEAVDVSVRYLGQQTIPADASILRLFHVSATPSDGGGRTVSTLVKQTIPPPVPLETNITSALTLGGNLDINGNAFTVTGRTSCGVGEVDAARIAEDSRIEANNASHMNNFEGRGGERGWDAIDRTALTRDELARDVLGGATLDQLIAQIPPSHRWGPRFRGEGPVRTWDGTLDAEPVAEEVAVVDADGGTIEVQGGEGLLIVVNGNISMRGNATFHGIIITEGSFSLRGTPTVTGALVSLARDVENEIDLTEEAEINGHVTIQYDRCEVDAARESFGRLAQMTMTPTLVGTFAWLEMTQ